MACGDVFDIDYWGPDGYPADSVIRPSDEATYSSLAPP